jgi:hypothetical protein
MWVTRKSDLGSPHMNTNVSSFPCITSARREGPSGLSIVFSGWLGPQGYLQFEGESYLLVYIYLELEILLTFGDTCGTPRLRKRRCFFIVTPALSSLQQSLCCQRLRAALPGPPPDVQVM